MSLLEVASRQKYIFICFRQKKKELLAVNFKIFSNIYEIFRLRSLKVEIFYHKDSLLLSLVGEC